MIDLSKLEGPVVEVSLDLTTIEEALEVAEVAVRAGVHWLGAGTPLVLAEGVRSIAALRGRFPDRPIVADLKIMDGGALQTELAVEAGASVVVVMARATDATVRAVVRAAHERSALAMGDLLGVEDHALETRRMERLGVDAVIAHIGLDERGESPGMSVFDFLGDVVGATDLPVQALGGVRLDQVSRLPGLGAPLVVVGAPLVVSGEASASAADLATLGRVLSEVVETVRRPPLAG